MKRWLKGNNEVNEMKKKNYQIELLRFIAAIVIVCHHSMNIRMENRIFYGGWIYVEFFYLLTGYFSAMHIVEKRVRDEIETVKYVLNKILYLIPYAYVGILIEYVYFRITNVLTLEQRIKCDIDILLNCMFLNHSGLGIYAFNGPLWYVQGILLVLPFVLIILMKKQRLYKIYLCWIIPISMYSILIMWHGTLQWWTGTFETVVHCVFRSCAAMMLGSFTYFLVEYVNEKIKLNSMIVMLLRSLAYFMFSCTVLLAYFTNARAMAVECVVVFVLIIFLIMLTGKYQCMDIPKLRRKYELFIGYLGRLSLPIFCLHVPIMKWISHIWSDESFTYKMVLSIVVTILCAILGEETKRFILKKRLTIRNSQ